jgi:hypothetical protein
MAVRNLRVHRCVFSFEPLVLERDASAIYLVKMITKVLW